MKNCDASRAEWGYFLDGEFHSEGDPLEVRSCYDQSLVATTFRPSGRALQRAVEAAETAQPAFARTPTHLRARLLRTMSNLVEERSEEFVRMLALEAGKPVKAGRVEVGRCVFNLRNSSEELQRLGHEFMPLDLIPGGEGRWAAVRRFPIGLVLAITPFNFPLNLVAHKVAPAIGTGNCAVQKPASKTPICSLMLAEIARSAGLPAGVLNVLPCSASQAGELVSDPRFDLLTFTGSAGVGWGLKSRAGKKRVTLELGGNAGVVIEPDGDVEYAAQQCALGGFSYAGQSCISVQRIFAHKSIYRDFLSRLADRVKALQLGDPLDEKTDVGPLITREDARRVASWVEAARAGGARIVTGGKRIDALLEPTVLTGTQPDMQVNCDEVFGPVVTVEPYDELGQALAMVNDSAFGLQAGIFTTNQKSIFRAFAELEVGGVVANDVPTFRADHMPYGGVKDSGLGREGAKYAMEEMTERKVLVMNFR